MQTAAYNALVAVNPVARTDAANVDVRWQLLSADLPAIYPCARRHRRSAWAIAVAGLVILATSGTAIASVRYPQLLGQPAKQSTRVIEAATVVRDYGGAHEGTGYANVRIAATGDSLIVSWHGPVPDDLQEAVVAKGVPVRYDLARYDLETLQAATQAVAAAKPEQFADLGVKAEAVGPLSDGSGLRFDYTLTAGSSPSEATIEDLVTGIAGLRVEAVALGRGFRFTPLNNAAAG